MGVQKAISMKTALPISLALVYLGLQIRTSNINLDYGRFGGEKGTF
jgi:hypothetical protein